MGMRDGHVQKSMESGSWGAPPCWRGLVCYLPRTQGDTQARGTRWALGRPVFKGGRRSLHGMDRSVGLERGRVPA